MRTYTAHRRPDASPEQVVLVKDGFSWPAFLFPIIWLALKRLWLALAMYILAIAALSAAAGAAELAGSPMIAAVLGINLLLGFEANDLNRRALGRRGFREEGAFVGDDVEDAELLYFRSHSVPQAGPAAATSEFASAARPGL